MNLSNLRRDFGKQPKPETKTMKKPFNLLKIWINEAIQSQITEANAMVLSTVGTEQKPSSRIVLLKEFGEKQGFIFYTDYESRKGRELAENPHASLHFFWRLLERQILIEGKVEKVSREKSVAYFNSRPNESRASTIVSHQSSTIDNPDSLIQQQKILLQSHKEFICPERWGGYSLHPWRIEFWQGGPNRLHYREVYEQNNGKWQASFLAP